MGQATLVMFSAVKLVVAAWLLSRTLPVRGGRVREAAGAAAFLGLAWLAARLGFSLYPPLTDDLSYLRGMASFLAVLALMVALHWLVWRCSLLTSVFCCSLAYSLEALSTDTERFVSTTMLGLGAEEPVLEAAARYWAVSVAVYAVSYLLLVRHLEATGLLAIDSPAMLLVAVLAIALNIVFSLALKDLGVLDLPRRYFLAFQVVYLGVCVFVMYSEYEIIYNRRLQLDVAEAERLREETVRQYEQTRDTVAAIDAKCHEIRHRVAQMESGRGASREDVAAVLREIDLYDSRVKTGNEALDVVIGERRLLCGRQGVTLACIADGRALAFVAPADLAALVGGALDVAVAAACTLPTREGRRVALNVRAGMGMAAVHLEAPVAGTVRLSDGFPDALEGPNGARSLDTRALRMVAASLSCVLSSKMEGGILHLNLMLPQPAEQAA